VKVLGVVPGSTDVKWALLEGTRGAPVLLPMATKGQKLPADENQALWSMLRLAKTLVGEQKVEKFYILQAGKSKFGGPSTIRVKLEAVFQIAAAEVSIAAEVVAPQTLRALEKRFPNIAGGTLEAILNRGEDFSPKPWRDAVLTAWVGLGE
jgi:hypothetical protein